ncbi:MAG: pantetheine-phosphate adenylyltransferase [Chloroflexi bacterium]|nr:pantetheine-phosphate adenylyltransferase [Chloroflexota bacterium]
MRIAVYPGSFDPVHYGHMDIAKRAAVLFDELILAVYDRPQKTVLFSVEERVALATEALKGTPNVRVMSYGGLTVDFVRSIGSQVIVRGLRAMYDFELEYQTAMTNQQLAPEVDIVCLMTSLEHAFISSTVVKEIAREGGPLEQFVPPVVSRALVTRLGGARRLP